jgi:2-methylcitrate dehydratase PrpD
MRMALGIATSMASGSRQNFGTMTKPLHAGLAARNGIEASLLAAKGFTADVNILESPMGFCRLFSPTEDFPTRSLEQLGDPWEILNPGLSVKKYPCCYATHNALDATLSLVQEHEIKVEEVKEVAVKVRPEVPAVLIHPRPQKGLEGKFSMQYCLAAAILDRKIALASFADQAVQRPEAQTLIQRVHMQEAFAASDASLGLEAEVTIDLEDGRSVSRRVDIPRGDAQSPLSWEELEEKFLDCASQALSEVKAQKALELIRGLEQTSLRELAQTLAGS